MSRSMRNRIYGDSFPSVVRVAERKETMFKLEVIARANGIKCDKNWIPPVQK